MTDLQVLSLLAVVFVAVLSGLEFFHKKMNVPTEVSRKIIHMLVGLICIFLPYQVSNQWLVHGLSTLFILFLYFSKKNNLLKSVHNINRQSIGAYLLPVSISFTFAIYQYYGYNKIFYLALIIVTISDPLASFAGLIWKQSLKKNNRQRKRKVSKTLIGSFTFFISAFISSFILLTNLDMTNYWHIVLLSLTVSVFTTLIEAISYRGWDNINIPITVVVILIIYIQFIA